MKQQQYNLVLPSQMISAIVEAMQNERWIVAHPIILELQSQIMAADAEPEGKQKPASRVKL